MRTWGPSGLRTPRRPRSECYEALRRSNRPRSFRHMGTKMSLQGKPIAPRNILAIKAEISRHMKPQHLAPDAAMMVLEANVMWKLFAAASMYRPTAAVQHANDALLVWCRKQVTSTSHHAHTAVTLEGWLHGAPAVKAPVAGGRGPRVGAPRGVGEGPLLASPRSLLGGVPRPPWWVPCGDRPRPMDPPLARPQPTAGDAIGGGLGGPAHVAPLGMPGNVPRHSSHPFPPPKMRAGPARPAQQPPPQVTKYDTAHGAITLVHVPRMVFSAALALEYHHLGDFYTLEGALRGANDLRTRALGPHGGYGRGVAPAVRRRATAPGGGLGPPVAAGPQDVGAGPNTNGNHLGGHRRAGGQDHPGTLPQL